MCFIINQPIAANFSQGSVYDTINQPIAASFSKGSVYDTQEDVSECKKQSLQQWLQNFRWVYWLKHSLNASLIWYLQQTVLWDGHYYYDILHKNLVSFLNSYCL